MAARKTSEKQSSVMCSICGNAIPPTESAIPTDYVWYDGKNICFPCLRNDSSKGKKEEEKKK